MKKFDKFNDLEEALCSISKHMGSGDRMVHLACNHIVEVLDAALETEDPRTAFIEQLQKDASYSGWKLGAPVPEEEY